MGVGGSGGVEVGPGLSEADAGAGEFGVGLDEIALGFVESNDGGFAGDVLGLDDPAILARGFEI